MKQRRATWGALIVVTAHLGTIAPGCSESKSAAPSEEREDNRGETDDGVSDRKDAGGDGDACTDCALSVEEFCDSQDCTMPTDWCVRSSAPRSTTKRGEGCLRVEGWNGFVENEPISVDVWDEESGELLFHSNRADGSSEADEVVGTDPQCGNELVCDTGYPCVAPPHFECFSSCYTGCLPPGMSNCSDMCGTGVGGLGGGGS